MAQHGFNTCHVFADNADTKEHYDLYKQVWNAERMSDGLNSHVAVPKLGLVRHMYIAPTDQQALVRGQAGLRELVPQYQLPVAQERGTIS